MGQPVLVVEKPSRRPGIVRFEANRNLSGMGHEKFVHGDASAHAAALTPSAELARRLFATGRVAGVHVYQNVVTVDLEKGFDASGLADVVRDLYQYWKPGMELPTFDDMAAESPADSGAAVAEGASPAEAEYLRRIPAVLVERSRSALARWRASH